MVEKVRLAKQATGEHELSAVLSVLELPRSTWYYHRGGRPSYEAKHAQLRELLEAVAREFPEYGYPSDDDRAERAPR